MDKMDFLEDIAVELGLLNDNIGDLIEIQTKLLKEVSKLNYVPYKP